MLRAFYEWWYLRGGARWDTGITPPELVHLIEVEHLPPGRALDIGCGTGTNVVYLAQHRFSALGIDFVPRAIEQARKRVKSANVSAEFRLANVLKPTDLGAPFDFVLDLGCFHNFSESGRAAYTANLSRWTHAGSTYLLYAFFPRARRLRNFGVAPEIVQETFARDFKLATSTVDRGNPDQDSAWYKMVRI